MPSWHSPSHGLCITLKIITLAPGFCGALAPGVRIKASGDMGRGKPEHTMGLNRKDGGKQSTENSPSLVYKSHNGQNACLPPYKLQNN